LQFLAHGLGVSAGGEGADLDVEEAVAGLVADGDGVAALFEGGEEEVGGFLLTDGGYLNHDGSRGRNGHAGDDDWRGMGLRRGRDGRGRGGGLRLGLCLSRGLRLGLRLGLGLGLVRGSGRLESGFLRGTGLWSTAVGG